MDLVPYSFKESAEKLKTNSENSCNKSSRNILACRYPMCFKASVVNQQTKEQWCDVLPWVCHDSWLPKSRIWRIFLLILLFFNDNEACINF